MLAFILFSVSRLPPMARTKGGLHPKAGHVHSLGSRGVSERAIAAETGLSKSTVHRILADASTAAVAPRGHDLELVAEYMDVHEPARSLDELRQVHRYWCLMRQEGYDVPPVTLRLLVALKTYQYTLPFGSEEYGDIDEELKNVYRDKRAFG